MFATISENYGKNNNNVLIFREDKADVKSLTMGEYLESCYSCSFSADLTFLNKKFKESHNQSIHLLVWRKLLKCQKQLPTGELSTAPTLKSYCTCKENTRPACPHALDGAVIPRISSSYLNSAASLETPGLAPSPKISKGSTPQEAACLRKSCLTRGLTGPHDLGLILLGSSISCTFLI